MPKHALACNESVSKHRLEHPCAEVLDVVLGIRHQHLFYEVMSAGQENALRTNAEARERTIVAGCFEQEVERAGEKLADVTANRRAPVVLEAAPGGLMGLLCSTNSNGLTCEPRQATMNSMMSCLSHSTPPVLNAPISRLCANR